MKYRAYFTSCGLVAALLLAGCAHNLANQTTPLRSVASVTPETEALNHFSGTLASLQQEDGSWSGSFVLDATMEAIPLIFIKQMGIHDEEVKVESLKRIFDLQDKVSGLWLKTPSDGPSAETTGIVLYTLRSLGVGDNDERLTSAWRWFRQHRGFRGMNLAAQLVAVATGEVEAREIPFIDKLTTEFFSRRGAFSLVGIGSWRDMLVPYLVWNFYHAASSRGMAVSKLSPEHRASAGTLLGTKVDPVEFESKKEYWAQEGLAWLLGRQQADGSWCGYIPCLLYSSLALKAATDAGAGDFSAQIGHAWQAMRARRVNSEGAVIQAPSTKAIWDTSRSLTALSNLPAEQRLSFASRAERSVGWLLDNEITTPGNWSIELPGVAAAGWPFQTNNIFNPDTDDTSQAIGALIAWRPFLPEKKNKIDNAISESVTWLLHFQQKNGGFAAFSKMNFRMLKADLFLYSLMTREHLPNLFLNADNDVTARVIMALKAYVDAFPQNANALQARAGLEQACRFLFHAKKNQEWAPGGAWSATWMIDYLHGTSQAIEAILTGHCANSSEVQGAVSWLGSVQDVSGGWGESSASYQRHQYVKAAPTLSQTEFVIEALLAFEQAKLSETHDIDPAVDAVVARGIAFLLTRTNGVDSPKPDGITETFIPKIWYGSYELQPHYELVRVLAAYERFRVMKAQLNLH